MWKAQDGLLVCRQNAALTSNGTGSGAAVTCIAASTKLSGGDGSCATPSGSEGRCRMRHTTHKEKLPSRARAQAVVLLLFVDTMK